jgi:tight adherence protein B
MILLLAGVSITIWLGTVLAWALWENRRRSADVRRIKARLAAVAGEQDQAKAARSRPALIESEETAKGKMVLGLLKRLNLMARFKSLIEQAGLKWNPARTVHACLALFLAGFFLARLAAHDRRAIAPAAGAALASLPLAYLLRKRRARLAKFEEQFPESLEFLGRSMRAGHAFSVSIEMIHSEFRDPLAGEFRRVYDEQNLGLPLEAALEKLAERVPLMDVHFFVSAVLLQKRTGGNLAELLDKLAYLIRERFKLRGRIRAISAHGRMTGAVLSLIPVAVGGIMFYINPSYAQFFSSDSLGKMMIGGAVALQLIGYGVIKKIVSIEV